jgi:hypothetical protein
MTELCDFQIIDSHTMPDGERRHAIRVCSRIATHFWVKYDPLGDRVFARCPEHGMLNGVSGVEKVSWDLYECCRVMLG